MSIHGICFDNGMAGRCNGDCESFLKGDCDEGNNMINSMSDDLIEHLYLEYQDPFRAACLQITTPELNKRKFIKEELSYE